MAGLKCTKPKCLNRHEEAPDELILSIQQIDEGVYEQRFGTGVLKKEKLKEFQRQLENGDQPFSPQTMKLPIKPRPQSLNPSQFQQNQLQNQIQNQIESPTSNQNQQKIQNSAPQNQNQNQNQNQKPKPPIKPRPQSSNPSQFQQTQIQIQLQNPPR